MKSNLLAPPIRKGFLTAILLLFLSATLKAQGGEPADIIMLGDMQVPNVELVNQYGKTVKFYDLIQGKAVAINFIFTTCGTICPPMGANFSKVKSLLGDAAGKEVAMISISLDPANDTPERLLDWQAKFGDPAGWTMLTGKKTVVDKLLKALKVYTPLKEDHAPIILLGRDGAPDWVRTNGLADAAVITGLIQKYMPTATAAATVAPADADPNLNYFTDLPLIDQDGRTQRFYSDLLDGKTVVINVFFSECPGTCPVMSASLREVQDHFGGRMGSEISILSISVDSQKDKGEVLKAYAERFGAKAGWYFLTGDKENVDAILGKIGLSADVREAHKTIFLVGNVKTRLWKKVDGLGKPQEIISIVEKTLHDEE